jgi:hypothetical protein
VKFLQRVKASHPVAMETRDCVMTITDLRLTTIVYVYGEISECKLYITTDCRAGGGGSSNLTDA